MKKLFAYLLTILAAASLHAADVRIVNNIKVDLQPVHDWFETKKGERPMPHWKNITVLEYVPGGPWPTCKMTAESASKTVYLKNLPASAAQYWVKVSDLKSRISNLQNQVASDTKRLREANAVQADYDSDFYRNREVFGARLQNSKDDLESLRGQLSELQSQEKETISEFAMFTGQIYNKMEVWDCGQKQ